MQIIQGNEKGLGGVGVARQEKKNIAPSPYYFALL